MGRGTRQRRVRRTLLRETAFAWQWIYVQALATQESWSATKSKLTDASKPEPLALGVRYLSRLYAEEEQEQTEETEIFPRFSASREHTQ